MATTVRGTESTAVRTVREPFARADCARKSLKLRGLGLARPLIEAARGPRELSAIVELDVSRVLSRA
jgi:hypothetical protein